MGTRNRLIPALAIAFVISGVLWGTAGYALYFRTEHYRHKVETELADFFRLPVQLGRVEPNTLHSRVFRDVTIWLPNRRDRVFSCPTATWRESGSGSKPDVYLDLADGVLSIGSEFWLPEDYRRVLRSAFSRDIDRINLRQVLFHGMRLVWPKGRTRIVADDVTGEIVFDDKHRGEATFVSRCLNDHPTSEPIHIYALVRPREEEFLPEVHLTVPKLPISVLNLDQLVNAPIRTGEFEGRIIYRQHGTAEDVQLSGQADGLELRELTEHAPFGPVAGRLSLRIEDAQIAALPEAGLKSIRFSGRVQGLDFGPLAKRAGYPEIVGHANLIVYQAFLDEGHLRELSAGGRIEGVPLAGITRRLGRGSLQGELLLRINALRIVDDQIASLDADVDITPPKGHAGTIDRELLLGTFKGLIGMSLPEQMFPEQIEYARMGAKLFVHDGRLRLLGSVGPGRQAMILLRLLGQDIPIPAPTETFSIQSLIDRAQAGARNVDLETIRRWWRSPPTATQPNSQPTTRPGTCLTTQKSE